MPNKENVNINDPVSERVVLSALLQHGSKIFYDVADSLKENDFYFKENKIIYSTFKKLVIENGIENPDINSIVGLVSSLDKKTAQQYDLYEYLSSLSMDNILEENVQPFVNLIIKKSAIRNLILRLESGITKLKTTTGTESLIDIINLAEKPINEFTNSLISENEITKLNDLVEDYIKYVHTEKPEILGIPSGFPIYDKCIGKGFRAPGFHLVGARSGVGKSFLAVNAADFVTKYNIPVLYLDTEMDDKMTMNRWLAKMSGLEIDNIETGQFEMSEIESTLMEAKKRPFHYINIASLHHTEWISIIRKWLMKEVGFDENGNLKKCLVIIDYIKTMNLNHTEGFDEFQYLGQVATDLHNLCIKYRFPMLALCQLNRDGITRHDQGVVSGSDRILFLCSSFTIMANKSDEDLAGDPKSNGDKKLIPIKTRFGCTLDNGEYINLKTNLAIGLMQEGKTNVQNRKNKELTKNKGLVDTGEKDGPIEI